jgi:hypothetical protein
VLVAHPDRKPLIRPYAFFLERHGS